MWKKFVIILFCLTILPIKTIGDENFLIHSITDFSGGLVTQISPNIIAPNQATELDNFLLDEDYGLTKRKGIACVDTLPVSTNTKILGSYVYNKDDGSSYFIVQAGSNVYTTSQLGKAWTLQKAGLSTLYPVRWATHYNKAWGANGVNDVMSFNGETLSTYSFIPKGRFIVSAQARIWIASTIDEPNYVYFSDQNVDPTTSADWELVNALRPGLGDGQVIKGLNYDKDIIWVYKDSSIYKIYDIGQMLLHTANYGTVSQESINSYQNGTLFLDKKGIYYNAGGNVNPMSDLIKDNIQKIGLISGKECRWTTTSSADFSTGTFDNCYNNLGTVEMSTSSKKWTTTADFEDAGYSVNQATATNDEVKLALDKAETETPASWVLIDLTGADCSLRGNSTITSGAITNIIDSIAATDVIVSVNQGTDNLDFDFTGLMGDTVGTNRLKKIKIVYSYNLSSKEVLDKVKRTITGAERIITTQSTYERKGYITEEKKMEYSTTLHDWMCHFTFVKYSSVSDFPITNSLILQSNAGYEYPAADFSNTRFPATVYTDEIIVPNDRYDDVRFYNITNIKWRWAFVYKATVNISEVEAYDWKLGTTTTSGNYYPTGTYTSSIFDTAFSSPSYNYLTPSEHLKSYEGDISSGTITYSVRTGTDNTGGVLYNPTAWYQATSTFTDTAIDGQQYFQWKAELWTSSVPYTPTCYNTTLKYMKLSTATYTSKVLDVGPKIVSWGAFATDDEGTMTYKIRGATWNFSSSDTSVSWSDITSGSDITLATDKRYIQWRGYLDSKSAKLKAVHITWFEGSASMQNVASINIDDKYYLAHSTWTTYNDKILILNKNNVWERWTDVPVSSFAKFLIGYYACSSTQPVILELFTETTTKEAKWKSGHLSLGLPDIDKILRYVYLVAKPQSDSFCWFDYSVDKSTITKSVYVNLDSIDRSHRIPIAEGTQGKNFYFTIRSTATVCGIQGINAYFSTFKLR